MVEIQEKDNVGIVNMIYEIRGQQVMLDSDLAILYGTETKRINEAVKNNKNKFPERFAWQLTNEEYQNLKSKFSTSKLSLINTPFDIIFFHISFNLIKKRLRASKVS